MASRVEDGPGVSLFQGSEMLRLNDTIDEEFEEEERQEEAYRLAQLHEMMETGFDDLPEHSDNEESFVDNSHNNSSHIDHQEPQLDSAVVNRRVPSNQETANNNTLESNGGGDSNRPMLNGGSSHRTSITNNDPLTSGASVVSAHYGHCYNTHGLNTQTEPSVVIQRSVNSDVDQMAELYSVRMREMVRLQEASVAREKEYQERCEKLMKKSVHLEAQKAALHTTCTQTQALLVSSKEQVAELVNQIEDVSHRNMCLETKNEELRNELSMMQASMEALQTKVNVLERGPAQRAGDVHMDALLKTMQERHRKELMSLQSQLQSYSNKLEASERAREEAEQKIWDATRRHEAMLLERSDTVNKLTQALEESQKRSQQLLAAREQQPSLQNALSEKHKLETQVTKLQEELKQAKLDVEELETVVGLGALSGNIELSNKAAAKTSTLSSLSGLQEELARSLRNQEVRRTELKSLREELRDKEQDVEALLQRDSESQHVINELKAQCDQLKIELQEKYTTDDSNDNTRQEVQQLRQRVQQAENENKSLEQRVGELTQQNFKFADQAEQKAQQLLDAHSNEYLLHHQRAVAQARHEARDEAEKQIVQLTKELEMEKRTTQQLQTEYVNLSKSKDSLLEELEKLRTQLKRVEMEAPTRTPGIVLDEQIKAQYEQKIAEAISIAKQETIKEIEAERRAMQVVDKEQLQAEVLHLKLSLRDQAERMRRERQEAEEQIWMHFRQELDRVASHSQSQALLVDTATSPISQVEPNEELKFLHALLEEKSTMYEKKLLEMKVLSQEKQRELEEFKNTMIEYTKKGMERRESELTVYIDKQKEQIMVLRLKCGDLDKVVERLKRHVEELKQENKDLECKNNELKKSASALHHKKQAVNDYYQKREKYFANEYQKRENKFYDILLKLKQEIDSLSSLEFPKFDNSLELPTKE